MRKDRSFLILVLLTAASLALTAADRRGFRETKVARNEIERLASVLSWRGSATLRGAGNRASRYLEIFKEKEKKVELKKQIKELEAEIIGLREVENQYDRLTALSDFESNLNRHEGIRPVPARITGVEMSNWHRTITIDRGAGDGVRAGAPVVAGGAAEGKAAGGIVGRVFDAGGKSSIVLLLTDHDSSVGGMIQRTRVHGIVRGTLSGRCVIEDISNTADVRKGDVVLSSGMGGTFPKGLIIGKVSAAGKRRDGFFQKIEVTPFVDISKTEEVIVLGGRDDDD